MKSIYVGRLLITTDVGAYAAQTQGTWRQEIDLRGLNPPFQLMIEQTDVDAAVTTVGVQAKLQLANRRDEKEAIPSTRWQDAEEGATVIATAVLTAEGAEKSNVLNEPGAEFARVLFTGTSLDWKTDGCYFDAWILGKS